MPKITLGITGLYEILGRDYGIEEPYWDSPPFSPFVRDFLGQIFFSGVHGFLSLTVKHVQIYHYYV